jgi:RNA polymerase sigma-70 factor (ECF subfamily)
LRVVPNAPVRQLRLLTAPKAVAEAPAPTGPSPTPSGWDDNEMVAAVRAGDEAAAGAFHDRLRPRVEATVRRLLGPRDPSTEDVGQLAMMALIEGIDRYRGECSLDSWASAVTAHVVYKQLRRRKLERQVFTAPEDFEPRSRLDPARALVARDLVRRARALLGDVSEDKAWTFLLHDVCGFDLREIATITGVTPAAAQKRLVRGRREIHERVAADPELAAALGEMQEGS